MAAQEEARLCSSIGGVRPGRVGAQSHQRMLVQCMAKLSPEEKMASVSGGVVQVFRTPGLSESQRATLVENAKNKVNPSIVDVEGELCFNVSIDDNGLTSDSAKTLGWLLKETFEPENLTSETALRVSDSKEVVIEVGPRMSFSTAWAANAISICQSCSYCNMLTVTNIK